MTRTTAVALTAGSLVLAALVALGTTASVLNAQASPATPSPKATQSLSTEPVGAPTDGLPPEKAAIAAQEAKDAAENAAKAADPASRAKGAAEKAAMDAEASASQAAATPQTLQEYCQAGSLDATAVPGTTMVTTGGWEQFVGSECLTIYVGAASDANPNDGAVFILHQRNRVNAPGNSGAAPAFGVDHIQTLTVPGSGTLTVQSAGQGGKLYLTSASGKTYTVLGQADQVKPGRA